MCGMHERLFLSIEMLSADSATAPEKSTKVISEELARYSMPINLRLFLSDFYNSDCLGAH